MVLVRPVLANTCPPAAPRLAPLQKSLAEPAGPGYASHGRWRQASPIALGCLPREWHRSLCWRTPVHLGDCYFRGRVMSRFYERYGLFIVWLFTAILGIALVYWSLVALATQGEVLPSWINVAVLAIHNVVVLNIQRFIRFVEMRIQWFGALATLGTFVFGLVTGIRQAKHQLPRRLMQFMQDVLQPVYDNSEALVNAVAYRSANVPHRAPLYLKAPLNYALDALGRDRLGWRPRKPRSLDESIKEADSYIDVTEKRLQYLKDIRPHAQILRGADRSYDCIMRPCDDKAAANTDRCTEADFTEAIKNDTTKLAALELRGLLRVRKGNLEGALEDFEALEARAKELFNVRAQARALRLQSEILLEQVKQLAGKNVRLLRQARRNLNNADNLFEDGRTLGNDDWLERGRNREAYGEVQAAIATAAGTDQELAKRAFKGAITNYNRSRLATSEDIARPRRKMESLGAGDRLQSP